MPLKLRLPVEVIRYDQHLEFQPATAIRLVDYVLKQKRTMYSQSPTHDEIERILQDGYKSFEAFFQRSFRIST